jgi:membrane protease YdiL (CAAX protease family)
LRIPTPLAWQLLLLTFFTAGLLRQFHDRTPASPYVPAVVGSLLFAAIFLILLVSAWEIRRGGAPGHGIRLGSLTPILLMLLIEKWVSLSFYVPLFNWIAAPGTALKLLDAQFLTLAGVGLLLVCSLVCWFSAPAMRKTWRRARPARWPAAALATLLVVAGTYLLLGTTAWALGGDLRLRWPEPSKLLAWIICGQAVLAFAEELYYRGLLMSEMERLAPRLGASSAAVRRWIALLATSLLFGMEHLRMEAFSFEQVGRQMIFTVSLGLLLGLLIMVSRNLHFSAGIHAWINCLLLGAAPHFVNGSGQAAVPAGTYIGLTMILAFVWAYVYQQLRRNHRFKAIIT